jgi:hypothetical protein
LKQPGEWLVNLDSPSQRRVLGFRVDHLLEELVAILRFTKRVGDQRGMKPGIGGLVLVEDAFEQEQCLGGLAGQQVEVGDVSVMMRVEIRSPGFDVLTRKVFCRVNTEDRARPV